MANIIDLDKKLISSVKELIVYQKAYAESLALHKASLIFPKIEQFALADQLRRSSKSICANLAEGYARQQQSKIEFKRFIALAIGSCNEVSVWLDYALDLGYITSAEYSHWQQSYLEIYKMLISLRNKIKP